MKTKRSILSVVLALVILLIPTAVHAKELGRLTITGPGIQGEITVTDPSVLMKLMDAGFFDEDSVLKGAPANLGEGYTVTSYLDVKGTMTPFIEMVYYPIETGTPGYMQITGRLDGSTLRKVDEWATISAEADKMFRIVMAANKVTLQSAVIAPQPASDVQPASDSPLPVAPTRNFFPTVALIVALLAVVGSIRLLRRRSINQHNV